MSESAEVIREKGTNRGQFIRGEIDLYTWVGLGSSLLMNDITAAVLYAQLEAINHIRTRRLEIWNSYHQAFQILEESGSFSRPVVPGSCDHNGHIYYLILSDLKERTKFIEHMAARDIGTAFHYVPLHSSPFGQQIGRTVGDMKYTDRAGDCLVRLPIWPDMTSSEVDTVISEVFEFFDK